MLSNYAIYLTMLSIELSQGRELGHLYRPKARNGRVPHHYSRGPRSKHFDLTNMNILTPYYFYYIYMYILQQQVIIVIMLGFDRHRQTDNNERIILDIISHFSRGLIGFSYPDMIEM